MGSVSDVVGHRATGEARMRGIRRSLITHKRAVEMREQKPSKELNEWRG